VIPTGVNLKLFQPQPKEQARAILGWEQQVPIVLFHGGSRPRLKGAQFVQAAVRAAEVIINHPIQLVNLNGEVPCEVVPNWLNACDCVAVASLQEGSPNIVKEALACNVPVVTTDVGDVAERLQGVRPSKVVRRDVTEFGAALASVLMEKRASNGREKIVALSEQDVALAIRSVYIEGLERCA
jgi:glycosyltransferase involved in cell wall biosynthesis